MTKKAQIAVVILVVGSLFGVPYGFYRYQFPFGMYHRCDKQLSGALWEYAQTHGGKFPAGEATPEASLSLLGEGHGYLLVPRDKSETVVEQMLARGELLGPDTCGWNYTEGLCVDSNSGLALFWDKEGLNEMGGRLGGGGHLVTTVGRGIEYIPASRWDSFLEEQRRLLAEEKAKTQHHEKPPGPSPAD